MNGICPICEQKCGTLGENEFFPFCSVRCRLVDLGRWLGEEYFISEEQPIQIPDEDSEA
jgi:endogenous inhibitor of DNA gyrase (YacG/DUF329 family)